MIFKKIPMNRFEGFHKMFSGSNENTFNICQECGGACERNKIGTLLPGEKEYIAKKMGISVSEFEVRYLDILKMDDETQLYVLKLGKLCPFLNEESEKCECRNFKPVFCKIYPVVFTVEDNKINFIIDDWCRLSRKRACRIYFETSIPLLLRLPIPIGWFRHVVSYDNLCFDYEQLEKHKNGKNRCVVFSLEELLSLQKTEVETVNLCIDFGEEVEEPLF